VKARNVAIILTLFCICTWAQDSPVASQNQAAKSEENSSSTDTPKKENHAKSPETTDASAAHSGIGAVPGLDPKTGRPQYESIHENWQSLSVKGSDLHPEEPLLGQIDEQPTFTRTLVALKWRPGDALDVYVILPKGVTKPAAVLYLYSYLEDTERFTT